MNAPMADEPMEAMKTVIWKALAWQGTERMTIAIGPDIIRVTSRMSGAAEEGAPFDIDYAAELRGDWSLKRITIASRLAPDRRIELWQPEPGIWRDADGSHLTEFDGCRFIDISLTPWTNTLPIRALDFADAAERSIEVIYIDLPAFTPHRARQNYSRIGASVYRYTDAEHPGFQADIIVDGDGLVVDYPGLFTRAEG